MLWRDDEAILFINGPARVARSSGRGAVCVHRETTERLVTVDHCIFKSCEPFYIGHAATGPGSGVFVEMRVLTLLFQVPSVNRHCPSVLKRDVIDKGQLAVAISKNQVPFIAPTYSSYVPVVVGRNSSRLVDSISTVIEVNFDICVNLLALQH